MREGLNVTKQVVGFRNCTTGIKLLIKTKQKAAIKVYAFVDWAADTKTRKFTTGNIFLLEKSSIDWCTKKQNYITFFSDEEEYMAASTAAQEIMWLVKYLKDLNLE